MTVLMQYLGYAIAFACVLFAAHFLLLRPANRTPSLLLSALFLIFALQSALLSILLSDGTPAIAVIARPSLAMTIGPLLFLYFTSAANPDSRLGWRSILHFVPAALIAFEMTARIYWVDIDLAIITSFAAYTIVLWRMARRGDTQFAHLGDGRRDAFRILVAGAILLSVSLAGEILIVSDIVRGGSLSTSIPLMGALIFDLGVISIATLTALQRPSPFDWLYKFGASSKGPSAATMTDAECNACIRAFEDHINDAALFDGQPVGLSAMAKRLEIPARRLSEAVNRVYGESYSRRINRWRVDKAKKLLQTRPDATITEVMFDAGFSTKSSFNREFRSIEGGSPSEYKRSLANSNAPDTNKHSPQQT